MRTIYAFFKALGVLTIGLAIAAVIVNDTNASSPWMGYSIAATVLIGFSFMAVKQFRLVRDIGILNSLSMDEENTFIDVHEEQYSVSLSAIDTFINQHKKGFEGTVHIYGKSLGTKIRIETKFDTRSESILFQWDSGSVISIYQPKKAYLADGYLKIANANYIHFITEHQQVVKIGDEIITRDDVTKKELSSRLIVRQEPAIFITWK